MKTSAVLLTLTMLSAISFNANAQNQDPKAGLIEQNFIYELTDKAFVDRSAYVNATLQYYVNHPEYDRVAIVETLLKLVRCDASKETRFAALLAVTVLNDEHLMTLISTKHAANLSEFAAIVNQEVGLRYFANVDIK
jgi:hypothetical protein